MPGVRLYFRRQRARRKLSKSECGGNIQIVFVVYVWKWINKKKGPCGFSFGTAGVKKEETSDAIKLSCAATRLKKDKEKDRKWFDFIWAQLSCVALTKATVVGFPGNWLFACHWIPWDNDAPSAPFFNLLLFSLFRFCFVCFKSSQRHWDRPSADRRHQRPRRHKVDPARPGTFDQVQVLPALLHHGGLRPRGQWGEHHHAEEQWVTAPPTVVSVVACKGR